MHACARRAREAKVDLTLLTQQCRSGCRARAGGSAALHVLVRARLPRRRLAHSSMVSPPARSAARNKLAKSAGVVPIAAPLDPSRHLPAHEAESLRRRSFCRILQDGKAALGQHCRHHHRPARRDGRPGTWGGCGARRALAGCAHESAGARSAERVRGFCRDSAGFSSQNRQPVRAEAGQWAK